MRVQTVRKELERIRERLQKAEDEAALGLGYLEQLRWERMRTGHGAPLVSEEVEGRRYDAYRVLQSVLRDTKYALDALIKKVA